MSMISFEEIIRLIRELTPPLVEGLNDYQMKPAKEGGIAEGPCVEARIGRVFTSDASEVPILGYDFPDHNHSKKTVRYAPKTSLFLDHLSDGFGKEFDLRKNESVLVETVEKVHLPNSSKLSLLALVEPRFSLSRMGVLTLKSDADPGYEGKIVLRLINAGPHTSVKLALGARIAKLRFVNLAGGNPPYVGKYGGKPGDVFEQK